MIEQEVKTKWADMDYVKLSYNIPLDSQKLADTITMIQGEDEDAWNVKGYWQDRRWGCESCGMVAIRVPLFHVDTEAGAYIYLSYLALNRSRIRVQWSDSQSLSDADAAQNIMGILYPDGKENSLARSIAGMEAAMASLKRTMDGTPTREPQNSEITTEPLKEKVSLLAEVRVGAIIFWGLILSFIIFSGVGSICHIVKRVVD